MFLPTNGFSGDPGALAVNLIDSAAVPVAPGLTAAQLASEGSNGVPLTALTGVDITATGGSTAFSAATIALNIHVTRSLAPPIGEEFRPENAFADFQTDPFATPERPLIPESWLTGSTVNRFIIEEQHAVISVPPNIFYDTLDVPQLTYEAKRPDGSALPSWLTFNPSDLTFSGTPPRGTFGRVDVLIQARDVAGNTADATLNVLIGQDQDDLAALLRPGHHGILFLPNAPVIKAEPARHSGDQTTPHRRADHADRRVTAQAALLATVPASPSIGGAGGFSSALHAAGPLAAIGRARAWLDIIDGLVRDRPAA